MPRENFPRRSKTKTKTCNFSATRGVLPNMKLNRFLLSAALLGGVLSTSAFATTSAAHAKVTDAVLETPVVTKVVSPTNLSRHHSDVITLSIQVDEKGQPSDIKVLSRENRAVVNSVVAAVSQWQFAPAKKNGVAVPSKVTLPLSLVESNS